VREILLIVAGVYGVRRPREKIDGLLDYLETGHLVRSRYWVLSGGERTRVNMGKAVINDPELILMDEPTASLDPDVADKKLGLIEELRSTADEFGRTHGIRVELWTSGREDELTSGQREVVFHIVREALTNVRRHSGSSVCRVRLAFAARPFLIEVTDEGKGFESAGTSGYGLVGMRERAAGIGGRLEVVSTPGRGTTVFLFGPEAPGTF